MTVEWDLSVSTQRAERQTRGPEEKKRALPGRVFRFN